MQNDANRWRPPLTDASKQIRLLRFLPDGGTDTGDPIRYEISVHDIDEVKDRYVAISYTWGNKSHAKHIWIDSHHRIRVRFNCWYALWQVRLHARHELYWIDSLCIDQDCHGEKQFQVGQMGTIYAQAHHVASCIGLPGEDLKLYERLKIGTHGPSTEEALVGTLYTSLAGRSYFRRLWTVQECIFAKRIMVFWGESCIPWSELLTHIRPLVAHNTTQEPGLAIRKTCKTSQAGDTIKEFGDFVIDCSPNKSEMSIGASLDHYSRYKMWTRPHRDMPTTIIRYCKRECSDPHDKLYGLLPLLPPAVRQRIPIDYDKPLAQVLVDYVCALDGLQFHEGRYTDRVLQSIVCLTREFAEAHEGLFLYSEVLRVWQHMSPEPNQDPRLTTMAIPCSGWYETCAYPHPPHSTGSGASILAMSSSDCWYENWNVDDYPMKHLEHLPSNENMVQDSWIGDTTVLSEEEFVEQKSFCVSHRLNRRKVRKSSLLVGACPRSGRRQQSEPTLAFEVPNEATKSDLLVPFSFPRLNLDQALMVIRPNDDKSAPVHVVGPARLRGRPFDPPGKPVSLENLPFGSIANVCCRGPYASSRLRVPVDLMLNVKDFVLSAASMENHSARNARLLFTRVVHHAAEEPMT